MKWKMACKWLAINRLWLPGDRAAAAFQRTPLERPDHRSQRCDWIINLSVTPFLAN